MFKKDEPQPHDGAAISGMPSKLQSNIDVAEGFFEHIVNSYSIDAQNEILFHIQKRLIENRREQLSQLEKTIESLRTDYEKMAHGLNVIS